MRSGYGRKKEVSMGTKGEDRAGRTDGRPEAEGGVKVERAQEPSKIGKRENAPET
jgi:hypothetical protein